MEETNTYPIVLVPGFLGFSREDIGGFYYWGGVTDLEAALKKAGYPLLSASCGPASSVWDRTCELYACIKGGAVDYGEAHSKRYGHARFGKTFPGIYPEWGEVDPETGILHRIHLIGHSLGGNTARLLVHLLANGSPSEIAASAGAELSPLFTGGKDWVRGVVTFVTPHDGTTLVYHPESIAPQLKQMLRLTARAESLGLRASIDFMLEQWGLGRDSFQDQKDYVDRVMNFILRDSQDDTAMADLSPEGAWALNGLAEAVPEVYYFSWSAAATEPQKNGYEVPAMGLKLTLRASARFMGKLPDRPLDVPEAGITLGPEWRKNDGIVNTVSMAGPRLNSHDRIKPFSGIPEPGVWNHMGILPRFDHWDAQGLSALRGPQAGPYRNFRALLEANLRMLRKLPQ